MSTGKKDKILFVSTVKSDLITSIKICTTMNTRKKLRINISQLARCSAKQIAILLHNSVSMCSGNSNVSFSVELTDLYNCAFFLKMDFFLSVLRLSPCKK